MSEIRGDKEFVLDQINAALSQNGESEFWATKATALSDALLCVLLPLRDKNLLFTPELKRVDLLDRELFLSFCDLVSLKHLAFRLQEHNNSSLDKIDLSTLAKYLSSFGVDLTDELKDFPSAHYNLHIGIQSVLKKALYE